MKKTLAVFLAALSIAALGGCGKDKEERKPQIVDGAPVVIETDTPGSLNSSPAASADPADAGSSPAPAAAGDVDASATNAPFEESMDVKTSENGEMSTEVKKKNFEGADAAPGYTKYVSGDDIWGMVLPPDMFIGDEAETGVTFVLPESNLLTVSVMDEIPEIRTAEEAKEFYSVMGEIYIRNFTVMLDKGKYAGCAFDYSTEQGMYGSAKYVVKKGRGVAAAGANMDQTQRTTDLLREAVNSLVIFD